MSIRNILIILILITQISCKNDPLFEGSFASCNNGYYIELYVKGDSLKITSHKNHINKWTKFRKVEDTIYHWTAGEWIFTTAAIISFHNKDKFQLYHYETDYTSEFYRIKENIVEFNDDGMAKGFQKRFKESDCYLSILEFERESEYLGE